MSAAARAVPQVVSRGARTAKDWASGSFDEAGTRAAAATETTYQRAAAMAVRRAALELERKEAERLIALLRSVQLGAIGEGQGSESRRWGYLCGDCRRWLGCWCWLLDW